MSVSGITFTALLAALFSQSAMADPLSCDVYIDSQSVAHVRGSDESQAIACLGYVHGRDRGWQMDFIRRTAFGKKAELLGFSGLKSDFLMRLLGFDEKAAAIWKELLPEKQAQIESYVRGVNQGFKALEKTPSYEMKKFGISRLDPWKPEDTVMFLLLQAFDQTRKGFEIEVEENTRMKVVGEPAMKDFVEDGLPWETTILKAGEYQAKTGPVPPAGGASLRSTTGVSELFAMYPDLAGIGGGSNSWILDSTKSKSGKALFANDPHLALKHPPFWYWAHIEGGGIDAIGASLPGVPIIASGTNRKIAWGLTNSYLDCADLAYVPETDLKELHSERPLIWIKWGFLKLPFFFKSFQRTQQGWPLLPLDSPKGHRLVLRWTGFELMGSDLSPFLDLFKMGSVEEANRIFAQVGLPSWNFVFADTRGNIGYRAIGKVFRKESAPDFGIQTKSLSDLAAIKTMTPDEMPHTLKPARGWVATANNRHWPSNSALHGGRAYSRAFRAFRIEELLKKQVKHDPESLQKIQCDVEAVDARFILPGLLGFVKTDENAKLLADWDLIASTESRATSLYRRWVDRLTAENGLTELALYRRLQNDRASLEQSARLTFQAVVEEFAGKGGIPKWGDFHLNHFEHLMGAELFKASKPVGTRGDAQTVDPGTMNWRGDYYEHTNGSSQRLIVEMTDPPSVRVILAGPNPDVTTEGRDLSEKGSPWKRWADCEYDRREFPLDWSKVKSEKVEI